MTKKFETREVIKPWKAYIIESERGWGSHVEDTYYFETKEERDKYVRDYNLKYNTSKTVPDWYMRAEAAN